ncbi:MAG: carbamoyltransferase HypF [Synergistaceae bacterium]|jgi:hydrogenase maturation protein HypF|nr:carbamoyltransferase HypF [Synergistaceae bacterium]
MLQRADISVTGVVQGVGFRPFCARTAMGLGLRGTVRNTPDGVQIVVEGEEEEIDSFIAAVRSNPPDASAITGLRAARSNIAAPTFRGFAVLPSERQAEGTAGVLIPADLAVCDECLAEMRDPLNRRYRYPFINCTNCGPRYTIIEGLPYDRPLTTMSDFPMCPECEREYRHPSDRRYHAQPNACPVCGPKVWLADPSGRVIAERHEAVELIASAIADGRIVAIKGIGGFHIACLPFDEPVRLLRERKHRPDKPFALMVRDVAAARRLADITLEAERLLTSVRRPIVLAEKKGCEECEEYVSPLVAPGQARLGLMLPYAPLHHLLMDEGESNKKFDALIMTSANVSDAPIVSTEAEAFAALSGVADLFLCHNRRIHTAIDDSVVIPAVPAGQAGQAGQAETAGHIFLRRARGYVPNPIGLLGRKKKNTPDILAAGAQLKAAYTLTRGGVLFPGQYIGDMGQLATAEYYRRSLAHFIALYGVRPRVFAFDTHPNYAATEIAREFVPPDAVMCPVQHHRAHIAAVMLDNEFTSPVIGVAFDGTGYGDDGTIWGGEFMAGGADSLRRCASLLPFRLPGGENAIREPWRIGLALIFEAFDGDISKTEAAALYLWPAYADKMGDVIALLRAGGGAVTSSCGRLFDGFAAIIGLCRIASYDGQAAMSLEAAIGNGSAALPFRLIERGGLVLLDWREAVMAALDRSSSNNNTAAGFHAGLAEGVAEVCAALRDRGEASVAALSGGVWQNARLTALAASALDRRGFSVLTHRRVSPNDECVSVGQAYIAHITEMMGVFTQ